MEPARILKEKIAQETVTTGVLATFHLWPGMVDMLMRAGIDYLIIDREHGTHSDDLTADVCTLGRLTDFPVLIRPIDDQYATIRRAMDFGPCGLLLPAVESTEQLDRVRDSIYMPPRGKRRPGGAGNFWVPDVQYETWKRDVEADVIVLPQIETKKGLDAVEAICAHELTTAGAIGPYDLSAELGVCWDPTSPLLLDAIQTIRSAAAKAGKTMWTIGDGPSLVRQGFTFICIAEPVMLLQDTLKAKVRESKLQT